MKKIKLRIKNKIWKWCRKLIHLQCLLYWAWKQVWKCKIIKLQRCYFTIINIWYKHVLKVKRYLNSKTLMRGISFLTIMLGNWFSFWKKRIITRLEKHLISSNLGCFLKTMRLQTTAADFLQSLELSWMRTLKILRFKICNSDFGIGLPKSNHWKILKQSRLQLLKKIAKVNHSPLKN
jgi:hypothetical protein